MADDADPLGRRSGLQRLSEQADRVIHPAPDVICLQEITATTGPRWRARLEEHGWSNLLVAEPRVPANTRKPLCVMIASRAPITQQMISGLPWPERALAAIIDRITYVNVHSPTSTGAGLAKILTHEAVHSHLAAQDTPAALCGNLNTPRREHPDGRVWTFARTQRRKLRPERGEHWDQAELAPIKGLEAYGWRGACRELHGTQARELSWSWAHWSGGYRLDHLIASSQIHVSRITYVHERRTERLSDHSPLIAHLNLTGLSGKTA